MSLRGVPKAKAALLGKKSIVPYETEKKKKPTKTLAKICTPHSENKFLTSRKDGYSTCASDCPITGRLTWISTWEFAKVITSIISLPWQPHNTHSGFNESHLDPPTGAPEQIPAPMQGQSHPPELWGAPAWPAELGRAGASEGLQQRLPSPPPSSHEPSHGVQLKAVKTLVRCLEHTYKLVFGDTHQAREVHSCFFFPTTKTAVS